MLESYGVTIDPRTVVNELPPVGQALVAIARAAEELREYRERTGSTTSVLVLDEPTVFLPEEELQFLFDLIREVVAQGSSVIFISHDLAAVRTIADRVTVLRDGKLAATASMADVSDEQIVEFIVGPAKSRELHEHGGQFHLDRDVDRAGTPQLVVSGLVGDRVRGLDFEVAPGEIVGLAGLLGSGAEEVPYLLFGAQRASAGTIRDQRARRRPHPAAAGGAVGHGAVVHPGRSQPGRHRPRDRDRPQHDGARAPAVLDRWPAPQPSRPFGVGGTSRGVRRPTAAHRPAGRAR